MRDRLFCKCKCRPWSLNWLDVNHLDHQCSPSPSTGNCTSSHSTLSTLFSSTSKCELRKVELHELELTISTLPFQACHLERRRQRRRRRRGKRTTHTHTTHHPLSAVASQLSALLHVRLGDSLDISHSLALSSSSLVFVSLRLTSPTPSTPSTPSGPTCYLSLSDPGTESRPLTATSSPALFRLWNFTFLSSRTLSRFPLPRIPPPSPLRLPKPHQLAIDPQRPNIYSLID